ncbi:MAG: hypothetical protein ABEH89_00025 [bacterium]
MNRRALLTRVLLAASGVLWLHLFVIGSTRAQTTSYREKWLKSNNDADPFLELRNESGSDSPAEPEEPDTPVVDTPTVSPVKNPEEPNQPSSTPSSPDEARDASTNSDTVGARSSEDTSPAETTSDKSPGSTRANKSEQSDTSHEREDAREDDKGPIRTEKKPDKPSRRQLRDAASSMFTRMEPEATDGLTHELEPAYGPTASHTITFTTPTVTARLAKPSDDAPTVTVWWWSYRYWGLGGLVVLIITGIFFWFRRRRVTVVERNYPSAEEFFQDDLKRKRQSSYSGPRATDSSSGGSTDGESSSTADPILSKSFFNDLNSVGLDDKHQALVEMYYKQGLTRRETAERSEFPEGEVGLVLDLADRIKEEHPNGEGA